VSPEIRLVAVDLDGTLLSSAREIPKQNDLALARLGPRGVSFAIVTGRRFPAALPYLRELSFDPFVIANSGAIVKEATRGRILRRKLLSCSIAEEVLDIAARRTMEPVVHDGPDAEGNLILRDGAQTVPHLTRYVNQSNPPPAWMSSFQLTRDPVQIGFASSVGAIRDFEAFLSSELGTKGEAINLARTEYLAEDFALLDVLSAEASKAKGLAFLSDHLGIRMSETMAIGDNWNDVGMLELAGLGVIMANAPEELHSRGFVETTSNDDAGVARAIERHVLSDHGEGDDTKK